MQILDSPTQQTLIGRFNLLTPTTPAHWGRMSANQMLCHLNDTYALPLGHRSAGDQSTFASRTLLRWVALRIPFTWPKNVPTRPEFDPLIGGTQPVNFETDRAKLISSIERLCITPALLLDARHPVFGPLTEWEWRRWAYLHTDHHLRQFGL